MTITAEIRGIGTVYALVISADQDGQDDILLAQLSTHTSPEAVISEALHEQWEFINPEEIGALTNSPILAKSDEIVRDEETGEITSVGTVAWYPQYEVTCPWSRLVDYGEVVFSIPQE